MRAAALIAMVAAVVSTGCAPMYAGVGGPYTRTVSTPVPREVIGRWDNVMMLPTGSRVHVLLMDGGRAEGDVRSASSTTLNLAVASGEIELPVQKVARVDRSTGADRVRRGLSGVAHGVGFVGLMGLIAGQAPPSRLFAAGAIAGAERGLHGVVTANSETIYVSPQLGR